MHIEPTHVGQFEHKVLKNRDLLINAKKALTSCKNATRRWVRKKEANLRIKLMQTQAADVGSGRSNSRIGRPS